MNKKIKITISLIIALVILIGVVIGFKSCQKGGIPFFGEQGPETYQDNSVSVAIEKVATFNPVISTDKYVKNINKLIYSGLFSMDVNMMPREDLAASYEFSDDQSSVTIKLKRNVKWHDGASFTAEDVKFTIDAYKSTWTGMYYGYVQNIASCKIIDESTVVIYYGSDPARNLESLTFPILPSHCYKNVSEIASAKGKFVPVGTGPFQVETFEMLKEIVLVPNRNYYGDKATSSIRFEVLPNENNGITLMDIADIDILVKTNYDRDTLLNNIDAVMYDRPSGTTEIVGFNMYRASIADKHIRQGICSLINTEEVLEDAFLGKGIYTDSLFYPGYYGTENAGDIYPYSVEEAHAAFKKAGYSDRDGDGLVENANGEIISISILVDASDSYKVRAAGIIAANLRAGGIDATVDAVESGTFTARIYGLSYDIFVGTVNLNERFDLRNVVGSSNVFGYYNEDVARILGRYASELSSAAKVLYITELKEIMQDEVPFYPLINKTYGVICASGFADANAEEGDIVSMFNNPYIGAGNWSMERVVKQSQLVDQQDEEE